MKNQFKKFILLFLMLVLAFSLISCEEAQGLLDKLQGNETQDNENNEVSEEQKIWNLSNVYDEAQALGYEGTLAEFVAMVSGKNGADGKDGIDGKDGTNGKDGIDGTNGEDGISITGSSIDENGHLILILSNGKELDAGKVTADTNEVPGVFKVTFDFGDGTVKEVYSENYRVTPPDIPTRYGYNFDGWYYTETYYNNAKLLWLFDAYAITKDMTLTANWTHIYSDYNICLKSQFDVLCGVSIDIYEDSSLQNIVATGTTDTNGIYSFRLEKNSTYVAVINTDTLPSGFEHVESYYEISKTEETTNIIIDYSVDSALEPGWWDAINYEDTELVFQMTECTNNQELSSGCHRYLAGDKESKNENIDDYVAERNKNAEKYTKVSVKYQYYPDLASKYGFANARNAIESDIMIGKASAPDMYCNFLTDMLICSLKGCFANLFTTKADNFFYFNYTMSYDDNDQYNPYMIDYMASTTLVPHKMYLIVSDYFIDMMRAAYIVPVNAELFNIVAGEVIGQDLNGDGAIDIEDFFEEVKPCDCLKCEVDENGQLVNESCRGNWTYDRIVDYATAIYEQSTGDPNGKEGEDVTDTLGWALGANGLPGAGLLYSSSIKLIEKTSNGDGTYNYSYPADNQSLVNIVNKIDWMMKQDGIYCVTASDARNTLKESTVLLGIRQKFTTDSLLFGGITLLGHLEYSIYQDMKNDEQGGFGVVPVPVYQQGDAYLTQIHTVGRCGAINNFSTKFSQCSAYLQYQSTNSTEILNEFYDYNLVASTAAGVKGNKEMVQYIRQNVRTSFDKLYEDAIQFMYNDKIDDEDTRYHARLCQTGYEYGSLIATEYANQLSFKSSSLEKLEVLYEALPC
ncbi:MAG: InlB B-repeat-containing protein [Clostridia bacterium]|nr:InlB B-repeat-containing protein [Clostridia bacterium]